MNRVKCILLFEYLLDFPAVYCYNYFMLNEKIIKNCKNIINSFPQIKLAYFFGSQANNHSGPLSDYDFAVYSDERDAKKNFELISLLQDKLGRMLKSNAVDIVILNSTESPEIKYEIIKNGRLIYEQEPYKILIEPRILNEYFDFREMMRKYNLTKS